MAEQPGGVRFVLLPPLACEARGRPPTGLNGLDPIPERLERGASPGQRQPRPGGKIVGRRRPVATQVPLGEPRQGLLLGQGVLLPEPLPDEHIGRLVAIGVRPPADLPDVGSAPKQMRRLLTPRIKPHPVIGKPLNKVRPGQRGSGDLLERNGGPLKQLVPKPQLPPPRRPPPVKIRPKHPIDPPKIPSGDHVQGPPHGPGPNNTPLPTSPINISGGEPTGPNPHSEPTGPHVLSLQPDNPSHRLLDGGRTPTQPLSNRPNPTGLLGG